MSSKFKPGMPVLHKRYPSWGAGKVHHVKYARTHTDNTVYVEWKGYASVFGYNEQDLKPVVATGEF